MVERLGHPQESILGHSLGRRVKSREKDWDWLQKMQTRAPVRRPTKKPCCSLLSDASVMWDAHPLLVSLPRCRDAARRDHRCCPTYTQRTGCEMWQKHRDIQINVAPTWKKTGRTMINVPVFLPWNLQIHITSQWLLAPLYPLLWRYLTILLVSVPIVPCRKRLHVLLQRHLQRKRGDGGKKPPTSRGDCRENWSPSPATS